MLKGYLRKQDTFKFPYHDWLKRVDKFYSTTPHPVVESRHKVECKVVSIYVSVNDVYYLAVRVNYKVYSLSNILS